MIKTRRSSRIESNISNLSESSLSSGLASSPDLGLSIFENKHSILTPSKDFKISSILVESEIVYVLNPLLCGSFSK